jgi:small GTP-binding protein
MNNDLDYSLEEESYDERIRMMLLGDSNVGKTSILKRYCKNQFSESYISSMGIDFETKYIKVGKKTINLQIWDTAGQERYKVIAKNYYNKSDGFIVVYDITNKATFNDISGWISQIKELASHDNKYIIVGNKYDLEEKRKVTKLEGENLSKKYNCQFFEVSAQSGKNIDKCFLYLAQNILQDVNYSDPSRKASELDHHSFKGNNKKKKCC